VPLRTFVLALLLGRGLRYFIEGILAVRYGNAVFLFMIAHKTTVGLAALAILASAYALTRLQSRDSSEVP